MSNTKKKMTWKRRALLFEEALQKQELAMAKLKGLLGTMIYFFGEDCMKAVTAFSEDPTPENKEQVRNTLELRFMELNESNNNENDFESN